ncbi:MAG TPA: DUF4407 domain-containing protein [Stellaceae bacterium]|jgi:hypothetical protein|nr:DUF4407 domain-containing protein [Stellaceae bacterium]
MMDTLTPAVPAGKPGFITRGLICVAGADRGTLRECPEHDWDNVRAIGLLMVFVWVYQTALIAIVAHRLLASDGHLHLALVAVSMLIATMLLLIDSYGFCRAGFHADGIRELARAGLDISGGFAVKLTAGMFLAFRILLALVFAQLTAVFMSLILYHSDVMAHLEYQYQQQNAALVAAATHRVDDDIQQATEAVNGAEQRVDALQKQIELTLSYLRGPQPWRNQERARGAQTMLPELQRNLETATSTLATLRANLTARVNGRDTAIQEAIRKSPAHVEPDMGILAQISALRQLAGDPEVLFVIILIDLTSFGLDTAAVLAKTTTFIPTTYAALLARNAYAGVVAIADELEEIINRSGSTERENRAPPTGPRPGDRSPNVTWFPTVRGRTDEPMPGRRPRGRPRKDSLNGGSPSAPGKDKQNREQGDEGQ